MVGKKGRSGRKPRNDGLQSKAVALYIDHSGKTPITWFRFFKRIHGSRWQEKVRQLMRDENARAKRTRLWCCDCDDELLKWHHYHNDKCHRCQMYKNEITRRIYER